MAAGAYGNLTAADVAKAKIFPALITKIEIRASGENVSQYQDLGKINEGEITAEPAGQPIAGGSSAQMGWNLKWKATVVASGTTLRTALALVTSNFTDVRITDINGIVHVFTNSTELHDMTVNAMASGNGDKSEQYLLEGAGYLTAARFVAAYTGV